MRNPEEQAQFEAEEKRMTNQVPFDPAKHGVGTMTAVPATIVELHGMVRNITARLEGLEEKGEVLASGAYNMIVNRIENLEKTLVGLTDGLHALNQQAEQPADSASPFGKKK